MILNKCPCEECIVYAICKQKVKIRCNELYLYVNKRNRFPRELPNATKIYHSASYIYPYLNRGTTRWFPDL